MGAEAEEKKRMRATVSAAVNLVQLSESERIRNKAAAVACGGSPTFKSAARRRDLLERASGTAVPLPERSGPKRMGGGGALSGYLVSVDENIRRLDEQMRRRTFAGSFAAR